MKREVVITGMGMVSSLGFEKKAFIEALISGTAGICDVTLFDVSPYASRKAAEIKSLEDHPYYSKVDDDRTLLMAMAAARQALEDAKLDLNREKEGRVGLWLGTTTANIYSFERFFGEYFDKNNTFPTNMRNSENILAGQLGFKVAKFLKISGAVGVLPTVCASGTHAIAMGTFLIRSGMADVVFAGGADALNDMLFAGFSSLRAMSSGFCSPFSLDREGLILGEGAGVLVLEEKEKALTRKARVYAKIEGFGISCDARHISAPDPEGGGAALAIQSALDDAGVAAHEIDYINAHGTGTILNDVMETKAIKKVFGSSAYQIPISSIKAMLGHTMGVAGALEAIACVLSMQTDKIPPTINYKGKDPDCDLDYVPNVARTQKMKKILSNSFGFGGNNACVILGGKG